MPDVAETFPEDPNDPALKYFKVTLTDADKTLDMRVVKTEVCHVYKGGFAEKNGVEVDDEIWDLDGVFFGDIGKDPKNPDKDQTDDQVAALKKRPLTINFKRPKYKDTYFEVEFADKKIGVKYLENVVTTVHPGEWADRVGVKPGDVLLTMNGRLFEHMTSQEVFQMVRNGPKPIKMYFKRPAEVHINQAALAAGATFELDLKENPNDPAQQWFDLTVEQPGGLGMRWVGVEIVHIVKESWAAIRKVEVDDEIAEVNGVNFFEMTDDQKAKALDQKRPFNIKFRRPKFKDQYIPLTCDEMKLGLKYYNGTITSLHPDSWGEKNGVLVGDVLLQLNGQNFADLTDQQVIGVLQGPRPLKLLFKRPAKVNMDLHALKQGGRDSNTGAGMGGDQSKANQLTQDDVVLKESREVDAGDSALCCFCFSTK